MTRCARCGLGWSGTKTAHCGKCHHTFTTYGNFDRHLDVDYYRSPRVRCQHPEEAGLVRNRFGRWHEPGPDGVPLREIHGAAKGKETV